MVTRHESARNEYGMVADPDPPSMEFTVTVKGVVQESVFEFTVPTIVAVSAGGVHKDTNPGGTPVIVTLVIQLLVVYAADEKVRVVVGGVWPT